MARAASYIALLGVFFAAAGAVAGIVAARRFGSPAYEAAAVSVLLNWIAGGSSIALVASARTRNGRINAALGAMLLRMALPMAAILFFTRSGHPLAQSGVVGMISVLYLAGLAVETLLSVRIVATAEHAALPGER